jgi:hypothetical protein
MAIITPHLILSWLCEMGCATDSAEAPLTIMAIPPMTDEERLSESLPEKHAAKMLLEGQGVDKAIEYIHKEMIK